jgi:hypothetical protein
VKRPYFLDIHLEFRLPTINRIDSKLSRAKENGSAVHVDSLDVISDRELAYVAFSANAMSPCNLSTEGHSRAKFF